MGFESAGEQFNRKPEPQEDEKKQTYLEQLKEGRTDEIKERRKKLYGGALPEEKKVEPKEKQEKKVDVDMEAFQDAYKEWLNNPKGKERPKPRDFLVNN